jgi:hypothetical protein
MTEQESPIMTTNTSTLTMQFYVWSDRTRDFILTDENQVFCPECGSNTAKMGLCLIDPIRREWMLECECGEQFYTHND